VESDSFTIRQRDSYGGNRLPIKTILIEDNELIRVNLIPAMEELANLEILAVTETEGSAIQILEEFAPIWEIVVVDLFLAEGSGMGVLKSCASRLPHQKAYVLTNYPTPEMRRRCKELGADGVFDKSNELDAFFDACLAWRPASPSS